MIAGATLAAAKVAMIMYAIPSLLVVQAAALAAMNARSNPSQRVPAHIFPGYRPRTYDPSLPLQLSVVNYLTKKTHMRCVMIP